MAAGITLRALTVSRASLEQAFFALTDAAQAEGEGEA
jgi:hypothetical protein